MTRLKPLGCGLITLFLLSASSLLAQTKPVMLPPGTTPSAKIPGAPRAHQEPCWQQAGISRSALQQRRQIEDNARAQVQAVCADSSLTLPQKREKIREIHQQTRQQAEALVSPQQQEALRACQQQRGGARGGGHGGGMHPGGGGAGPCGEMTSGKGIAQPAESEPQPQ